MSNVYGLESCLHSVRRRSGPLIQTKSRSGDYDTPDGPAHLKGCCAGASERERDDLAGIRGGVCDEESPGNTC